MIDLCRDVALGAVPTRRGLYTPTGSGGRFCVLVAAGWLLALCAVAGCSAEVSSGRDGEPARGDTRLGQNPPGDAGSRSADSKRPDGQVAAVDTGAFGDVSAATGDTSLPPADAALAADRGNPDSAGRPPDQRKPQGGSVKPPDHVSNYVMYWHDEFESLSLYHPTDNPQGRWRHGDFWGDALSPGYVDFAAVKTFNVNQVSGNPATKPYPPLSLNGDVLRITARRAHLNERPELRALVNKIAVESQGQPKDNVTWLGAWISAYRAHKDAQEFKRPAYVEARIKWSPGTTGLGSAFWLYTSRGSGSTHPEAEIDICDLVGPGDRWYTHLHTGKSSLEQENVQSYSDDFHVYGLHWTEGSLRVYRDNKLVKEWTGAAASFYVDPMRVIFSLGADMPYLGSGQRVPENIEELHMDVDWVRVWRAP